MSDDRQYDDGGSTVDPEASGARNPERRQFLKGAAMAAGGIAGGLIAGSASAIDPRRLGFGATDYEPGDGSMMFMEGHDMQGAVTEPPGAPADDEVAYRHFDMSFDLVEHTLLPGVTMPAFAFNGQVPGPVFRVQEHDWLKVSVRNNTSEMHTIHWHGVDLPYTMDGVPMMTQDPIHPDETFIYRFQAYPAGTRFYHCHWDTPLHLSSAMHGAFIVDSPDDPVRQRWPYTRDYVLMLESFDVQFARSHLAEVVEGMRPVNEMMRQGTLSPITHGFFRGYDDLLRAIDDEGWRPPWTRGNAEGGDMKANFFAINGKAFPETLTDPIQIRMGETIRVRLINAGSSSHAMHLHGHQFLEVAEDGNPIQHPRKLNTVHVTPGKTKDIIIHGNNPGFWAFHDHTGPHLMNDGVYPGGMLTMLTYEEMGDLPYVPSVSVNQ